MAPHGWAERSTRGRNFLGKATAELERELGGVLSDRVDALNPDDPLVPFGDDAVHASAVLAPLGAGIDVYRFVYCSGLAEVP